MVTNLDKLSAESSQKILELKGERVREDKEVTPGNIEKICTSALAVIQEQGLYAGFLFLLSKSGKGRKMEELSVEEFVSCNIVFYLVDLLNSDELWEIGCQYDNKNLKTPLEVNIYKLDILKHVNNVITADLKKLLLIKSIFQQTLIYARYCAKALNVSEGQT